METQRLVVPAAEEILNRYFPVLDHGFVALVDYMGGDKSIERFARTSYTVGSEVRSMRKTRDLLRYLFRKRHTSPFEACEVTLHLGLPIIVMRQLVRHRTASLNEFSQRYSPVPLLFYTPNRDEVRLQSGTNKQGSGEPVSEEVYQKFVGGLEMQREVTGELYRNAIHEDIAREMARIDLPLSTYTYCYWKMDTKNFLHLVGLRSDKHAQAQTQAYSDVFAGIAQRLIPLTFEAFQDYQQTAVSFTQVEMSAIRLMSVYHNSPISWDSPLDYTKMKVNEHLQDYGCTNREIGEFWEKVKTQVKRDFSLDLSKSQDAAYYSKLVEDHQIEGATES